MAQNNTKIHKKLQDTDFIRYFFIFVIVLSKSKTIFKNQTMKKLSFLILMTVMMNVFLSAQDIQLPAPDKTGGKPLMQALSERKTTREFRQNKDLSLTTLSNLLWAANGFNRPDKRTAPTANNRQELELYIAVRDGLYFYDAKNHKLKLVKKGDYRKNTGMQDFVGDASLNVIFVSDLSKATSRHFALIDCGFVSQNIYLFCASEGLNTVVRGSFDKDELGKLLNLPSNQEVLLTQSVGYPK
jgi:SagB-type dehydrogenase family enzyme